MSVIKIRTKGIKNLEENYTKIKISGIAKIIYNKNVITCRNKFTRYLMSSIIVFIANKEATACSTVAKYGAAYVSGMSHGVTARIGINTSTPSSPDMSDLVNKVDVAPDSITRRLIKEPDYSLYIAEFVFTWNAGTLPDIYIGATAEGDIDGKVGEFGVYLFTDSDDWSSGSLNPSRGSKSGDVLIPIGGGATRLASRIASADDAFDAFEFYGSIDPLTFKWRFQVAIV